MKKILTVLLTLAMVMAMLPSMGAFAAETITGGHFVPQEQTITLQEGLTSDFATVTTTADGAQFSINENLYWNRIAFSGANQYDGVSAIQWKNLGTAELTYDIKYEGTLDRTASNPEEMRAGLAIKLPSSTSNTDWPFSSVAGFYVYSYNNPETQSGVTKTVKTVVTFGDDKTLFDFYVKDKDAAEYTFVTQKESNFSVSSDNKKITGVVPELQANTFANNSSVKVTISNVKIREYASFAAVNVPETCEKSGSAEISYNVPAGAFKAELSVGGKTVVTKNSPGTYKTTLDLASETGMWGNVSVKICAYMADGTIQQDTKTMKVTNGAGKATLGTEDFADDTFLYSVNDTQGKRVTEEGALKDTLSFPNAGGNSVNVIYADGLSYEEGYLCDLEFDYYQTTMSTYLYLGINADAQDSASDPIYGGKVQNNVNMSLATNEWHHIKITVDSSNDKWTMDVDNGTYTAQKTVTMNGIQSVKLGTWGGSPNIYIDNVKFSFYNNDSAPGVQSVTVNDSTNVATVVFDAALKSIPSATTVTFKDGESDKDALVSYTETTKTLTVGPSGAVTSANGEIVIDKSLFGTEENMVIPITFKTDRYDLTKVDGGFIADVSFKSNDTDGKAYVAIYQTGSLVKVVPIDLTSASGFQSVYKKVAAEDENTALMFVWDANLSPIVSEPVAAN